ncbi:MULTISPECIES: permease [Limnospira]|uniref:Permease n=1 Tax=Limnospira indica PCC 8005 TaxID=376219 RepID=A0A9P1KBQ1_9CYAN|nr:permease [Limnospira indica]CDM93085.1 putative permease [Limnospira indica PCC 8005]
MRISTFWREQWQPLALIVALFLLCFYLPVEAIRQSERLQNAFWESLYLVRWYAQEHVLLCLIPAFFIAGAIAVFISQDSVMKYLGVKANPWLAYGVASVSGTILAVCSCTVLPLFAGIYRMGAGLGPAMAFLYSGPAINVLAIILTARVLGWQLGLARAICAMIFSMIIGLSMQWLFRREETEKVKAASLLSEAEETRPLWQNAVFFAVLVGILVFANWSAPDVNTGLWYVIYSLKWWITGFFGVALAAILVAWLNLSLGKVLLISAVTVVLSLQFHQYPLIAFSFAVVGLSWLTSNDKNEAGEWFESSWDYAKQIFPLLLFGVLIAGALLGRPGEEALIPSEWVAMAVGGNSILANFFAAIAGAFMYFATLTEVPILQGLIGNGMGDGPALALLLAGPALSLPNMLVIRTIIGTKKTVVFVALVVAMATISGIIYGGIMAMF